MTVLGIFTLFYNFQKCKKKKHQWLGFWGGDDDAYCAFPDTLASSEGHTPYPIPICPPPNTKSCIRPWVAVWGLVAVRSFPLVDWGPVFLHVVLGFTNGLVAWGLYTLATASSARMYFHIFVLFIFRED